MMFAGTFPSIVHGIEDKKKTIRLHAGFVLTSPLKHYAHFNRNNIFIAR